MSSLRPLLAVVVLALAVVAALRTARTPPPPPRVPGGDPSELARRLDALEAQLRPPDPALVRRAEALLESVGELRLQAEALAGPLSAGHEKGAGGGNEGARAAGPVPPGGAGAPPPPAAAAAEDPDSPRYGTPEWGRRMERVAREARAAQLDWVASRIGLSGPEKERVRGILDLEAGRLRALHDRVQAKLVPVRALPPEVRRIRSERDDALRGVLGNTRFERYKKLVPDPGDTAPRKGDEHERDD